MEFAGISQFPSSKSLMLTESEYSPLAYTQQNANWAISFTQLTHQLLGRSRWKFALQPMESVLRNQSLRTRKTEDWSRPPALHFDNKAMTFHRDFNSYGFVSPPVQIKALGVRATWLLNQLSSTTATCTKKHRMFTRKRTSETDHYS